ncbi:MAG: hypothetical protein FWD88_02820 [Treponema sp.]|nr:hypothetical protein [Treponema sp.]
MKRFAVVALAVAVTFVVTSCGSPPAPAAQPAEDPVSAFIRETRRNAPENALLGIGTSTHSNRAQARSTAELRARAEVVRQLNVVVRNMVTDYMAGSEAEPQAMLSFQESVTQSLAESRLQGAIVRDETNIGGEQVVIVMLTTDNIASEIMSASQSAAALAPHMATAQWALERMNQALTEQNDLPPVIVRD